MAVNLPVYLVSLYPLLSDSVGLTIASLNTAGFFLAIMANDCLLLFIHLSYYSIAYYIRLLGHQFIFTSSTSSTSSTSNASALPLWKGSKKVLLQLCKASAAIGSVLSLPVLYIITVKLILVSFYLFTIVYGLVKPGRFLTANWILWLIVNVICTMGKLLIIFHAADMPLNEVRILK